MLLLCDSLFLRCGAAQHSPDGRRPWWGPGSLSANTQRESYDKGSFILNIPTGTALGQRVGDTEESFAWVPEEEPW